MTQRPIEARPRRATGFAIAALFAAALMMLAIGAGRSSSAAPPAAGAARLWPATHAGLRIEETEIPMPDGVRLAATLYIPETMKPGEKLPALLEYLPYRKDDGTAGRDLDLHAYFAHAGYVTARVDIRGTGRSQGRAPDREYSEQEQKDGMEVIAWLAKQPWSAGKVGMFGISWGGFNSIQHAMRRPPALKAIIAVEATDDLFQDDVHYIDGLFHVDEYEISMDVQPMIPPAPDYALDETILAARFDNPPWSLLYKKQQRDGPFWGRASLNRNYDAIRIPVFLVAGWYDGYRDSVPRMLEKMKTPVKALIGPWNHTYPHEAVPGPAIEWRGEAVRFWDHWLKGKDTGIMDGPRVAVYMRHAYPPDPNLEIIPGEWRSEAGWPPAGLRERTLHLTPGRGLEDAPAAAGSHDLAYLPAAGPEGGFWWGELLPDQRPYDALSLVYETEPLREEVSILGFPRARLQASASAPLAHWFVRLSDVAPDGSVSLVTGAGFNGAHRDAAERPRPLEPGRVVPLDIEMHVTSWVFPRGHRIRLAVSNALWPMVWPTPHPMTTTLKLGGADGSRLVLPVVPAKSALPPPRYAAPGPSERLPGIQSAGGTWPGNYSLHRDMVRGTTRVEWSGASSTTLPWVRHTDAERLTYEVGDADPARAAIRGEAETTLYLPDRVLTFRGRLEVKSDAVNFYYRHDRQLLKDGIVIRQRTWEETLPRDHQ